jgi:catechol 2,3-dioxygenase-like lactoylglutathione lyase family enzyme
VRATAINHVSISAKNLEESARFYETIFGMERIPAPVFETPVVWLRVGTMQLHLFEQEDGAAPIRHHLGLTVDDLDAAYEAVSKWMSSEWGAELVELPSGQIQLYFRDPGGNLIELNWPNAATLDQSKYPDMRRLREWVPQTAQSEEAVLYLDPESAPA